MRLWGAEQGRSRAGKEEQAAVSRCHSIPRRVCDHLGEGG